MERRIFKVIIFSLILLLTILTICFIEIIEVSLIFEKNEEQGIFGTTSELIISDRLNYQGRGGSMSYPNLNTRKIFFDRFALLRQNELRIVNQKVTSLTTSEINFLRSKMISSTFIGKETIFINGNDDFNVFPGAGTINDPFRIENFNITGFDANLIGIFNTNVHFRITNNFLKGTNINTFCISLFNVSNGVIEDNNILDGINIGILFENSTNNKIINNSVSGNGEGGIWLLHSSNNNQIINNTVYNNNRDGIKLEHSKNNLITNNSVYGNQWNGIHLDPSSENIVRSNNVSYNKNDGIYLQGGGELLGSADNIVINNFSCNNSRYGIFVIGSNNVIARNNVSLNYGSAIFVCSSDESIGNNNLIEENFVHNNNHHGLHFGHSDNNIIRGNYLLNIVWLGMRFHYSKNNTVYNNTITQTLDPSENPNAGGILIQFRGNSKIFNNTISDLYLGINPYLSDNNIIFNNSIINVKKGLQLQTCINNSVINNHFYIEIIQEHLYYGILSEMGSKNNFILNNSFSNIPYAAIYFSESSDTILSFNRLTGNNIGIFLLRNTKNNYITQNIIINSTGQGIRIEEDTENNSIKFNDFLNNNKDGISQATDSGDNNLFIFNYWNEWISPDINADGFTDNPYYIDDSEDNYDYYPLVNSNPPQSHLLIPPMVIFPNGGESLDSTITIQWVGSIDSFDSSISYSLYLSEENGESWFLIAPNITGTTFEWNITSSEHNSKICLIKIVASCGLLTAEDISDETFTLNYPNTNSNENLMRLLFVTSVSILLLGLAFLNYNSKLKAPKPFIQYFQSDQIEFLKTIFYKVIIGLENIKTNIIPESAATSAFKPPETIESLKPEEKTSLITYFPLEIHEILKSMRGRTALVMIEMAYQDMRETNPTKLSQSLNIPLTTISDEIKKLLGLDFIESNVRPSVIQDARFRYFNITSRGLVFLSSLKNALELSIKRLETRKQLNLADN